MLLTASRELACRQSVQQQLPSLPYVIAHKESGSGLFSNARLLWLDAEARRLRYVAVPARDPALCKQLPLHKGFMSIEGEQFRIEVDKSKPSTVVFSLKDGKHKAEWKFVFWSEAVAREFCGLVEEARQIKVPDIVVTPAVMKQTPVSEAHTRYTPALVKIEEVFKSKWQPVLSNTSMQAQKISSSRSAFNQEMSKQVPQRDRQLSNQVQYSRTHSASIGDPADGNPQQQASIEQNGQCSTEGRVAGETDKLQVLIAKNMPGGSRQREQSTRLQATYRDRQWLFSQDSQPSAQPQAITHAIEGWKQRVEVESAVSNYSRPRMSDLSRLSAIGHLEECSAKQLNSDRQPVYISQARHTRQSQSLQTNPKQEYYMQEEGQAQGEGQSKDEDDYYDEGGSAERDELEDFPYRIGRGKGEQCHSLQISPTSLNRMARKDSLQSVISLHQQARSRKLMKQPHLQPAEVDWNRAYCQSGYSYRVYDQFVEQCRSILIQPTTLPRLLTALHHRQPLPSFTEKGITFTLYNSTGKQQLTQELVPSPNLSPHQLQLLYRQSLPPPQTLALKWHHHRRVAELLLRRGNTSTHRLAVNMAVYVSYMGLHALCQAALGGGYVRQGGEQARAVQRLVQELMGEGAGGLQLYTSAQCSIVKLAPDLDFNQQTQQANQQGLIKLLNYEAHKLCSPEDYSHVLHYYRTDSLRLASLLPRVHNHFTRTVIVSELCAQVFVFLLHQHLTSLIPTPPDSQSTTLEQITLAVHEQLDNLVSYNGTSTDRLWQQTQDILSGVYQLGVLDRSKQTVPGMVLGFVMHKLGLKIRCSRGDGGMPKILKYAYMQSSVLGYTGGNGHVHQKSTFQIEFIVHVQKYRQTAYNVVYERLQSEVLQVMVDLGMCSHQAASVISGDAYSLSQCTPAPINRSTPLSKAILSSPELMHRCPHLAHLLSAYLCLSMPYPQAKQLLFLDLYSPSQLNCLPEQPNCLPEPSHYHLQPHSPALAFKHCHILSHHLTADSQAALFIYNYVVEQGTFWLGEGNPLIARLHAVMAGYHMGAGRLSHVAKCVRDVLGVWVGQGVATEQWGDSHVGLAEIWGRMGRLGEAEGELAEALRVYARVLQGNKDGKQGLQCQRLVKKVVRAAIRRGEFGLAILRGGTGSSSVPTSSSLYKVLGSKNLSQHIAHLTSPSLHILGLISHSFSLKYKCPTLPFCLLPQHFMQPALFAPEIAALCLQIHRVHCSYQEAAQACDFIRHICQDLTLMKAAMEDRDSWAQLLRVATKSSMESFLSDHNHSQEANVVLWRVVEGARARTHSHKNAPPSRQQQEQAYARVDAAVGTRNSRGYWQQLEETWLNADSILSFQAQQHKGQGNAGNLPQGQQMQEMQRQIGLIKAIGVVVGWQYLLGVLRAGASFQYYFKTPTSLSTSIL